MSKVKLILYMLEKGGISVLQTSIFHIYFPVREGMWNNKVYFTEFSKFKYL